MSDIIVIDVKKKDLTLHVSLPNISNTLQYVYLADDTRIARNGDVRIARNGDVRITRNRTLGRPRTINIKKKSLGVRVRVGD
jgi:hypothetical protein